MAPGDLVKAEPTDTGRAQTTAPSTPGEPETAPGTVYRSRVSLARRHLAAQLPALPFTPQQLSRLDEALTFAGRETGVAFSVYLGELGEDTRTRAEEMLASLGAGAPDAVLIAVSPGERVVELVTGSSVQRRITDRAARLAVTAMVASFCEGVVTGAEVAVPKRFASSRRRTVHCNTLRR